MKNYKKKTTRNLALTGAITLGLTGAVMLGSSNHSAINASADETNNSNLSQNNATDIPSDTTPNWQSVAGFEMDVPRANSEGSFAYCIDAGKSGATNYSGSIKEMTNSLASNVLCNGQTAKGKLAQYSPLNKYDENTRVMITQYAIWIALGEGNATDTGLKDNTLPVNQTSFYKKYQSDINGLVDYSKSHEPVKITPAEEQAKIDQAQKDLDKQAQDDVSNQLKTVTEQLKSELQKNQDTEISNGLNDELSKASKALHIDPVAVKNTDATKAKLGDKFDGDDAKGHLDDIENGSHDFTFKISHDDVTGVNWGQDVNVHFENKLPEGTEIEQNGKTITKDASKSQDYKMSYGEYTVKVPFSDKEETTTESLKATASLEASYTAKGQEKSQTVTSDKTSTVKFNMMGLGAGYKDPDNSAGQRRAVSYMVASPTTKELKAHASQDAKVSIPEKTDKKGGEASADYQFSFKRMLGRLVIDKMGVPSDPDAETQSTINKVESQNDFAGGFNLGQKPSKVSADGSDSNFTSLPQSNQTYQNGEGAVNAQSNANGTQTSQNGSLSATSNQKSANNSLNSGNIKTADGKVVKLTDVTFQLVPRTVKQLDVLKQYYPLADGNGSQITLPKVTDNNGQIVWDNIPYGDYDLIEVQTSTGYELNRQPIHVGADRYHVGTNNVIVKNTAQGTPSKVEIHTTAHNDSDKDSTTFDSEGNVKTHDTVAISNVQKDEKGTVKAHAVDTATKQEIPNTEVSKDITGTGKDMTIDLPQVNVNGKDVKGNIVWVETYNGKTVSGEETSAEHNDLTEKSQTLTRDSTPWLHTTAVSSDGDKTRDISKNETDVDTVAIGGNLKAGTYHVLGYANRTDNGLPVDTNAKATDITIKIDKDGETKIVDVPYTFDGTKYNGNIVFAEALYTDNNGKPGEQIAKFNDVNSPSETVLGKGTTPVVANGATNNTTTPTSTTTPSTASGTTAPQVVGTPLQQTGEQNNNKSGLIATIMGAITALVGFIGMTFRKKRN